MSHKSRSIVIVSKDVILQACQNAIEYVKKIRQQHFDEEVTKLMKPSGFWIWKSTMSKTEAEQMVLNYKDGEYWIFPPWKFAKAGIEHHAYRIMNAAKVSSEPFIQLDIEDAELVGEWSSDLKTI